MKQGLLGQETEYAIAFRPERESKRPTNLQVFLALRKAIGSLVATKPGHKSLHYEFFVENGGSFCYEFLPHRINDGLIEGRTPECHSALELVHYQRAQELLLQKAIPQATKNLHKDGFFGHISLIKNCKDIEGNTYGAQENYDASVNHRYHRYIQVAIAATIPLLVCGTFLYGLILLLMLTVYAVSLLVFFLIHSTLALSVFAAERLLRLRLPFSKPFYALVQRLEKLFTKFCDTILQRILVNDWLSKAEYYSCTANFAVYSFPFIQLVSKYFFAAQKTDLLAFFASRIVFSGAGTLDEDGQYYLAEKASVLQRVSRDSAAPSTRAIFDSGNLVKDYTEAGTHLFMGKLDKIKQLFRPRQRLQLGMSDSNRCQVAEYLKIGVTSLLVDMSEIGFLVDPPQLATPIAAVHQINSDPGLRASVLLQDGTSRTAIEIQEYYIKEAERFLATSQTVAVSHFQTLHVWKSVITMLRNDPAKMIGRLDWVSKRYLIEAAAGNRDYFTKKKIDIGYHELGGEVFDALEKANITRRFVGENEIEHAITTPTSCERVQWRSSLIKDLNYHGQHIKISWESARVGGWWDTKVLRFTPKTIAVPSKET